MKTCKTIGCHSPLSNETPHDFCPKCNGQSASNDEMGFQKTGEPGTHTAADIMKAGLAHMEDRAATYDCESGERSMGKTVAAFNIITGHSLTETEGWKFMEVLKMVRSCHGEFHPDSYEDRSAYAALAGESHAREDSQECAHS